MGNTIGRVCSNGMAQDDSISPRTRMGTKKVSPMNSQLGACGRAATGSCREISVLAFEVANTVSKVAKFADSLSEDNIRLLKEELSRSEGIRLLVSKSMEEMLSVAAADKRHELHILLREVARFGKQCVDPQWHNLDECFLRLEFDTPSKINIRKARAALQELTVLSQLTSELYHESLVLENFEQDYERKVEAVESLIQDGIDVGETITIFQEELINQRKIVQSLQNKSLWSKCLEEIVKKLVSIVPWISQRISKAFGSKGTAKSLLVEDRSSNPQKLGVAGLALHYAKIINQISLIASSPTSLSSDMRHELYQALPTSVQANLRYQLQGSDAKYEPTYSTVKVEIDRILQWLLPLAENTINVYQASGRIGEWASNSKEISKGRAIQSSPIHLQTLYYAEKEKTDQHIIKLVTLLNHLINLTRQEL